MVEIGKDAPAHQLSGGRMRSDRSRFRSGERFAELFPNAKTVASGLRVPVAAGDFMILDAIRESGGLAATGRETKIAEWMIRSGSAEGIRICPETAICFDVLEQLIHTGQVLADEEVLVFNTGAAEKYIEALPPQLPRIEKS